MTSEEDAIKEVTAVLSGIEEGVKIPPDKIDKLANTLVKDLGVTEASSLENMGSVILLQIFADAFPKASGTQKLIVTRWFKSHCGEDDASSVASSKVSKGSDQRASHPGGDGF